MGSSVLWVIFVSCQKVDDRRRVRVRDMERLRPIELAFFQMPLLALGWLTWYVSGHAGGGYDFAIFRRAGVAVLRGRSPYVRPTVHLLGQNDHFVYPMPFAYLFVPFGFVSERVGAVAFLAVSTAAVLASLRLLGVHDWRCYGLAFLGVPVYGALYLGAVGPLLLLLVAAAWRCRHTAWVGVLLALAAAAKLFLWPLLLWILVTRRFRAAAAGATTLAIVTVVWALADPAGLSSYAKTVRVLNSTERSRSYSLQTLWFVLGLPGLTILLVLVAALAAVAIFATAPDERRAFALGVTASLIATPILWLHYLVLLLVPIALYRPRLSWLWAVPLALWVTPQPHSLGSVWKIALVLATILGVQTLALVRRPSPNASSELLAPGEAIDSLA
jgi:hypothetical protein